MFSMLGKQGRLRPVSEQYVIEITRNLVVIELLTLEVDQSSRSKCDVIEKLHESYTRLLNIYLLLLLKYHVIHETRSSNRFSMMYL